jgi:hypothetical protein
MNLVIPIVAIVGALLALLSAAPLSARLREQAVRAGVVIGWLGALAGAAGIYVGEISGLAALLGVAACGGLAVLPIGMRLEGARDFSTPIGALIPLVVGLLGVSVQTTIAGGTSAQLLLYAGHWGTLGAALVAALVAAALASSEGWNGSAKSKTPGVSVGLALSALAAGAYALGTLRAGPEGVGWTVPLSTSAGPASWQIQPSAELLGGYGVPVVSELGWMGPLLIAVAVISLGTCLASRFGAGRRATALGWLVSAAASLSGVLGILSHRSAPTLPDASAYQSAARDALADVEGAQALVEQGRFVAEGDLFVPLGAVAPELAMLSIACFLGLVAGLFALRRSWPGAAGTEPHMAATRLYARDFSLRAIMLAWLSWLLVTLIHWTHFGAVGVGSSAEWSAAGMIMAATGVVLLGWSRRNSRVDRIVRELVPGVVFALLVAGMTMSLVFDAPFGLSLVF